MSKPPPRIKINGEMYRLVVLQVTGRDELGRPRECRLMYPGESTGIQGGEEFVIAFAHNAAVASRQN